MMKWIGSATGPVRENYEEPNRVSSYRGYLYKLRRSQNLLAPQWGKRWFSIEGHFLKWYRQDNDLFPSGMIDLKYIRSITKLESTTSSNNASSSQSQPYCFTIASDDRNLTLRASTIQEMNQWIRALHRHADIARGGKGTMVVSDFNQLPLNTNSSFKSGSSSTLSGPLSIKKNRGLRASMTLEQELDLTLKRLDDLEKEVVNSPTMTPQAPTRGHYQSPLDDEDDDFNQSSRGHSYHPQSQAHPTYGSPSSPSHYQQMTNKLLKNVVSGNLTSSRFDESMESISDAVVRTPKTKTRGRSNTGGAATYRATANGPPISTNHTTNSSFMDIDRVESFNSIEDISLSTKPMNRVKSLRMHQKHQQSQYNNPVFNHSSSFMGDFISRSHSNTSYDEYDSFQTRTAKHSNHTNGHTKHHNSSHNNNNRHQTRNSTDLTPITTNSDGEMSDEFDFTVHKQRKSTNHGGDTSSNNSNSHHQRSRSKGTGSPKRSSNPAKQKWQKQYVESNDSTDFIVEKVPSRDRYEEDEGVLRGYGRHSNPIRSDRDTIPVRAREFVPAVATSKEWKQATETEGVRKSRDLFGIKSAW